MMKNLLLASLVLALSWALLIGLLVLLVSGFWFVEGFIQGWNS